MIEQTRLEQFQEILQVVRWVFPGAHPVIGGGALRDSILGRPIKDVDVFLRAQDHDTLNSELTKRLPCSVLTRMYGRPDMHGAWDFIQTIEGYEVQLILADFEDQFELALTFDLGLSRVTYDGVHLNITNDFLLDAAAKKFTILRADNPHEYERTLRRVKRLKEKYPEYGLDTGYFL